MVHGFVSPLTFRAVENSGALAGETEACDTKRNIQTNQFMTSAVTVGPNFDAEN